MYSREKRMRAIELYIKYEKSTADVIRELGYPDRKTLREWYRMSLVEQETGVPHERVSKYSPEAKEAAVRHYLEHGRRISRTIRAMGYPSRETFRKWCNELIPDWCKKRSGGVRYAHGQEKETTATPPVRNTAKEDAVRMVSNRQNPRLPDKEVRTTMPAAEDKHSSISKEELLSEIESLRKQNKKLRLERDILKATAEIIKKDPGVDQKKLTNREKALVIGALRKDHPLKDLLEGMAMSRSSFFYQRQCLLAGDKYKKLKERITILFEANGRRYGYRRIHALLLREGIRVSEKVVRRCMAECSLIVFGRKRRRYSAYQGEKTPAARNWVIFCDSSTRVLKELHMPHETDPFAPSKAHLCKMILRAMRRESFTGGCGPNDPISGNTASSQSGSEPTRNCCRVPVLQENDSGPGRTGKESWN